MFFSTKCVGVCTQLSAKERVGARSDLLAPPAASAAFRMISAMDEAGKCSCSRSMCISSGALRAARSSARTCRAGAATKRSREASSAKPK